MYQEKIRTLHIYLSEEDAYPIVDAESDAEKTHPPMNPFGLAYCSVIGVLFTLLPLFAIVLAAILPPYDATLSKTLTLTLALHPTDTQVPLYQLPAISRTSQTTAPATGSAQEPATKALGLLTFYNGLFTSQNVPAGTRLTGKDGRSVVTSQSATIPPATPTTPPTDGTVSVTAYSTVSGAVGNIAAFDIQQVCCGGSILVQNLDAFSGGKDAQTVTVVTQSDITTATTRLQSGLDQAVNSQAQQELSAGQQLLFPLSCTTSAKASQQTGDQAQQVQIAVLELCNPLAYVLASVQRQVTVKFRAFVPRSYTVEHVSVIVLAATVTDATAGTAKLTVHITAFLQTIHPKRGSA